MSRSGYDFIKEDVLHGLLTCRAEAAQVRDVLAKSLAKEPLTVEEAAVLLAAEGPDLAEEIFDAARRLKRDVYGNRIVIFAPLYVGNDCTNDCQYCAFRRSKRVRSAARWTRTSCASRCWPWKARATSG